MSELASRDLLDGSAAELAGALAAREVSALELTDQAIARIEARDTAINAVVVRDFDRAREAARKADLALGRGERRPLLGVPLTVKEAHNVEGLPTTWGSPAFTGWTAATDSVGVQRLKAAGAVILGKTNVPPFLSDWQAANPVYGRTNNPWDPTRSPGGSSGGSAAALAAGMVPLEFGSDIGGSIRIPAAFCGVFGHKPTYELIPQRGHTLPGFDGAPTPMAVVGPLARTVQDLRLALDVLAGPEDHVGKGYRLALPPPRGEKFADFRVMILDEHPAVATDDEIRGAINEVARCIEALGAEVVRSNSALPDLGAAHEIYMGMLTTAMSRGSPEGSPASAHQWLSLVDAQATIRRRWAALFTEVDVVLAPAFGAVAFPHTEVNFPSNDGLLTINGKETPYFDQLAWPGVATLPELPATAAPIGFTRGGLPIGVQIVGDYLEDATTLAFAGLLEREFGGFRPPPPR